MISCRRLVLNIIFTQNTKPCLPDSQLQFGCRGARQQTSVNKRRPASIFTHRAAPRRHGDVDEQPGGRRAARSRPARPSCACYGRRGLADYVRSFRAPHTRRHGCARAIVLGVCKRFCSWQRCTRSCLSPTQHRGMRGGIPQSHQSNLSYLDSAFPLRVYY